jgi:putative hydrolase of the HAD superfamily
VDGSGAAENSAFFREKVKEIHEKAKAAGIAFPEVDAAEIWGGGGAGREKALRYELETNPVWPMPGARETIETLAGKDAVLGIVSNAQFFSPLLFDSFFGKTPEEMGFAQELLIWSYAEGEAKPSPALFAKMKERLAARGIAPGEALYTGNDMKNDILPAAGAGFKTALFAGDARSLRLRGMNPARGLPDLVLEDLRDLCR